MALHLLIVYNRWLQRYIEKLFELYATFGTGDQKVYFFTLFRLLLKQSSRQCYERSKTERANFYHQRGNM
jgi:hypothetical protein